MMFSSLHDFVKARGTSAGVAAGEPPQAAAAALNLWKSP